MTEQKAPSAMSDDTKDNHTNTPTPANGKKLASLAIVIALASGLGSAWYITHLNQSQSNSTQALREELSQFQLKNDSDRQQLTQQLSQTEQALKDSQTQLQDTDKDLQGLREKINSLTGNDTSVWLVSQADYLVKLAGRKLWSDQDVTTSLALLKSADRSLAQMDDPSILTIRRALNQDISTLATLNQVDYDGILLQVSQLANNVDNLRLADDNENGAPMDKDSRDISGSLAEWRHNLMVSWHDFMNNFITVRRRDNTAQPLLAPNQDIYLRENIRSQLLIAAQAIPRHQEEIYKQSLDAVSTWVRAWYNTNDPATKAFLAQVDQLVQTPISMDLPETLTSQNLLDKLMQDRVRGLMSSPSDSSPAPSHAAVTSPQQGG
ncbi:uroporphyrinogen-III C-methyltransferase [Rosenbergiella australiborealis]|uniref:Uroporphyrinogen-III C-methyltransferase n=1 Tax=Rosenbergiella australiborealis TaxID=1544696 RepID=A0ABS5T989_9GAMM|nr:uroporphyrinogen-III C-methyltransferase [Rosenbergiella australiborealis]MBT0727528.1 uroporphyrinogen-III C-methyltransferase [Rosenbergiella australiborealis]